MPVIITQIVLPLALYFVRSYLNNSDSSKDGEVLGIVKKSIGYLAQKDNNNVSDEYFSTIKKTWVEEEF
ncbi:hypothetical protein [Sulfuricurvum sp.]|uniref:hypothetical protein n=1 Tax=Sulfuricurvum sp. TaxID=2025608 RepID=UPI00260DF696|nr:hypothetical protein [Sulfuricurvum sp.]MDD4949636.1 hypothetical protein [Sulfuricurvum sp.]